MAWRGTWTFGKLCVQGTTGREWCVYCSSCALFCREKSLRKSWKKNRWENPRTFFIANPQWRKVFGARDHRSDCNCSRKWLLFWVFSVVSCPFCAQTLFAQTLFAQTLSCQVSSLSANSLCANSLLSSVLSLRKEKMMHIIVGHENEIVVPGWSPVRIFLYCATVDVSNVNRMMAPRFLFVRDFLSSASRIPF